MKKTVLRIMLIFVSLTLSLLVANAILMTLGENKVFHEWDWFKGFIDKNQRVVMPYVPDTKLIYKPNVDLSDHLDWIDSYGFRKKPALRETTESPTIIMVGDSFTFGDGVKNNEAYPFLVEKLLQERGANAIVHNAGVSGYGADQEFIYIRDYLIPLHHPTIIVWNFNINDVVDSNEACLFDKEDSSSYMQIPAWRNTLFLSGFIIKHSPAWLRHTVLFNLALHLPSVFTQKERYTFGCTFPEGAAHDEIADSFFHKLAYFLSYTQLFAHKNNVQIVTTLVPFQLYFDNAIPNQERRDYDKFRSVLSDSGLTFLDANELIAKQLQSDLPKEKSNMQSENEASTEAKNSLDDSNKILAESMFLTDNWKRGWRHLNEVGNMRFAVVVADKLQSMLIKR